MVWNVTERSKISPNYVIESHWHGDRHLNEMCLLMTIYFWIFVFFFCLDFSNKNHPIKLIANKILQTIPTVNYIYRLKTEMLKTERTLCID